MIMMLAGESGGVKFLPCYSVGVFRLLPRRELELKMIKTGVVGVFPIPQCVSLVTKRMLISERSARWLRLHQELPKSASKPWSRTQRREIQSWLQRQLVRSRQAAAVDTGQSIELATWRQARGLRKPW